MPPRVSTGDRDAVLRHIRWCAAVQTLVNCHCQLEPKRTRLGTLRQRSWSCSIWPRPRSNFGVPVNIIYASLGHCCKHVHWSTARRHHCLYYGHWKARQADHVILIPLCYTKKIKVVHTWLLSVGFRSWSGSWQSACRWRESWTRRRLPLLFARPAVTLAILKRAATSFTASWTEAQCVNSLPKVLPDGVVAAIWTQALLCLSPACWPLSYRAIRGVQVMANMRILTPHFGLILGSGCLVFGSDQLANTSVSPQSAPRSWLGRLCARDCSLKICEQMFLHE